jgi:hypothetical protein
MWQTGYRLLLEKAVALENAEPLVMDLSFDFKDFSGLGQETKGWHKHCT